MGSEAWHDVGRFSEGLFDSEDGVEVGGEGVQAEGEVMTVREWCREAAQRVAGGATELTMPRELWNSLTWHGDRLGEDLVCYDPRWDFRRVPVKPEPMPTTEEALAAWGVKS